MFRYSELRLAPMKLLALVAVPERFGSGKYAIAACATATSYAFRWQTSAGATAFVGMSLADLDGERVLGATRTWIA